jgi:soluble lytic murein transglycosylase-like protein
MDRARVAILAVCALLTTTIEPFDWADEATPSSNQEIAAANTEDGSPASALLSEKSHPEIVEQILSRFSMRHTALPERERRALVYTILEEARVQNLDPHLVVAVIEVESAGYHLAVSHVGAMGLMQLLPSTGKELAEQMGIEWKGPDTLFDPTINVKLGTAYLRQLADQFGSVSTALAAYNWGPGRINRRLRRGAEVPSRYIEQVMRAVDRNAMATVRQS